MSLTSQILTETSEYASNILNSLSADYWFHNLKHTQEVAKACATIAKHSEVDEVDLEILLIAAWFHDTGFSISPHNHEDHSAHIAKKFLKNKQYPVMNTKKALGCIRATQQPQTPLNILEKILCDADMYHLSTPGYWSKNQLLKKELQLISNMKIRDDLWCFQNLNFLSQHEYHTPYGKTVLTKRKLAHLDKNIQRLEAMVRYE